MNCRYLIIGALFSALFLGCADQRPIDRAPGDSQAGPKTAADPSAGKAVYDARCASCHQLGKYDTAGEQQDIAGQAKHLSSRFVSRHTGSEISSQDLANLRAFVAQQ